MPGRVSPAGGRIVDVVEPHAAAQHRHRDRLAQARARRRAVQRQCGRAEIQALQLTAAPAQIAARPARRRKNAGRRSSPSKRETLLRIEHATCRAGRRRHEPACRRASAAARSSAPCQAPARPDRTIPASRTDSADAAAHASRCRCCRSSIAQGRIGRRMRAMPVATAHRHRAIRSHGSRRISLPDCIASMRRRRHRRLPAGRRKPLPTSNSPPAQTAVQQSPGTGRRTCGNRCRNCAPRYFGGDAAIRRFQPEAGQREGTLDAQRLRLGRLRSSACRRACRLSAAHRPRPASAAPAPMPAARGSGRAGDVGRGGLPMQGEAAMPPCDSTASVLAVARSSDELQRLAAGARMSPSQRQPPWPSRCKRAAPSQIIEAIAKVGRRRMRLAVSVSRPVSCGPAIPGAR